METEFSYSSLIKNSAPIQIVVYYSSLIKHSAPIRIGVFHNIKNKTQSQFINYSPRIMPLTEELSLSSKPSHQRFLPV